MADPFLGDVGQLLMTDFGSELLNDLAETSIDRMAVWDAFTQTFLSNFNM